MENVRKYHNFINKIKKKLEKKYNVFINTEFIGLSSVVDISPEGKVRISDNPQFLIYIRTHDEYTHLDIVEYYETISISMTNLISFRYKINEQHYIHKRSIEFLM